MLPERQRRRQAKGRHCLLAITRMLSHAAGSCIRVKIRHAANATTLSPHAAIPAIHRLVVPSPLCGRTPVPFTVTGVVRSCNTANAPNDVRSAVKMSGGPLGC